MGTRPEWKKQNCMETILEISFSSTKKNIPIRNWQSINISHVTLTFNALSKLHSDNIPVVFTEWDFKRMIWCCDISAFMYLTKLRPAGVTVLQWCDTWSHVSVARCFDVLKPARIDLQKAPRSPKIQTFFTCFFTAHIRALDLHPQLLVLSFSYCLPLRCHRDRTRGW